MLTIVNQMLNIAQNIGGDPFYIAGGTLRHDAPCYVERQADQELFDALARGRFCYVLTARQMGKSSLMIRTAMRLRDAGVGVGVLDLTGIGQNLTAEQWYGGLLLQIGLRLDLEDELSGFWQRQALLGPLQRWMQALRTRVLPQYPGGLVIFIDEIDAVRSLPFSTDEFFAGIRECYNLRSEEPALERLTFCLLGVARPGDLIRETSTTPFNIGRRIELHDFTTAEAAPLARGLGADQYLNAALLKRIHYWTNGHPYLTQRLCQAVAETNPQSAIRNPQSVDGLCRDLFFSQQARQRDDNLLFVRDRLLRGEHDVAALLSLYADVRRKRKVADDPANPLIGSLHLAGVVRAQGERLQVRNRIYATAFDRAWVADNLPEAEARRQRAAYRRGLWRASAVAAFVLVLLAALALLALSQRNRALRQEAVNRRLLYRAEMNLAQEDWAAGNLARMKELLAAHLPQPGQADLRGFEWFYLWRLCHAEAHTLAHPQNIGSVAFAPDGASLVTGCADGLTRLWETATGRALAAFKAGQLVAFSRDGQRLATGDGQGVVLLWDVAARRELLRFEARAGAEKNSDVTGLAFAPDGQSLAVAARANTLTLWETATGHALRTFTGHTKEVLFVAFAPDGKQLVTGSRDDTARLWETGTGRTLRVFPHPGGQQNGVRVAFAPDGKALATGGEDYVARVWDVATGRERLALRGHTNAINAVAFAPAGHRLATGSFDHTAKLWDAATGQELATLKGHTGTINALQFSPDGHWLATGSSDRTAKLWEVAPPPPPDTLKGHTDRVLAAAFAPDGRTLATAGVDKTIKLWDPATGQTRATLSGHTGEIWSVAFSPDGQRLASASYDQTVKLWDVATGRALATLSGHTKWVYGVAFAPDGQTLASASHDETARLWEAATGRELRLLKGHVTGAEMGVRAVAFAPDGKILATASRDRTVKLWEPASGRELATLRGHTDYVRAVVFAPDGKRLASAGYDGTIKLWDAATGRELATLKGHASWIYSLAFTPDGRRLASGSYDQTVKLWDTASGQELLTLKGHTGYVYAVAFAPDGKMLATASADGTVKLWRAAAAEPAF